MADLDGTTTAMFTVASLARAVGRHPQWIRQEERLGNLPQPVLQRYRRSGCYRRLYSEELIWAAAGLAEAHGVAGGAHVPPEFMAGLSNICRRYGRRRAATAST